MIFYMVSLWFLLMAGFDAEIILSVYTPNYRYGQEAILRLQTRPTANT
jgi:hypothetical protein